jgi:hypothetical protein
MKITTIILSFLLVSCNFPTKKQKRSTGPTDPYFDDYVSEFIDYCRYYTNTDCEVTTTINFVDTLEHDRAIAMCYDWANDNITNEVLVKKSTWGRLNEQQRRVVIAHELGHCELHRGHKETLYAIAGRELALSVMYHANIYVREEAYDAFMKELFTGDDSEIINYYNERY